MLRKRAWDLMRTEFLSVPETTPLAGVIARLLAQVQAQPDHDVVVVVDDHGHVSGILTLRDLLRVVEDCVLTEEMMLHIDEADWDRSFSKACSDCCGKRVKDFMERRPTVSSPTDPLVVVIDALVTAGARFTVVCEGDKPLGVVLIGDVFREVSRGMELPAADE